MFTVALDSQVKAHHTEALLSISTDLKASHKALAIACVASGHTVLQCLIIREWSKKGIVVFLCPDDSVGLRCSKLKRYSQAGIIHRTPTQLTPGINVLPFSGLSAVKDQLIQTDLIIIEDCHFFPQALAQEIISPLIEIGLTNLVGITFSSMRAGASLWNNLTLFNKVSHSISISQLIDAGRLTQVSAHTVYTDVDLSSVSIDQQASGSLEYNPSDLLPKINKAVRNKQCIASYLKLAANQKVLFICINSQHAEDLAIHLNKHGVPAAPVHKNQKVELMRKTIAAFDRGAIIAITCDQYLLDRFEDATVSCLVFAAPLYSLLTYQRYLGLGLRIDPDNDQKVCTVIDIKDESSKAVNCSRVFDLPSRLHQSHTDVNKLSQETKELLRYHPLLLNMQDVKVTRASMFTALASQSLSNVLTRIQPLVVKDKYLWLEWDRYHWFALLSPHTMVNLRINELGHHIVSIDKRIIATYTGGRTTQEVLEQASDLLTALDVENANPLFAPSILKNMEPASEAQMGSLDKKWRIHEDQLVNLTKSSASRMLYTLQLLSLFCQKHYRIGMGKYFGFPVPYLLFTNPEYVRKYAAVNPLLSHALKNPTSWIYWLEHHKPHIWHNNIISKISKDTLLQYGAENLETIRPLINSALVNDLEFQALSQKSPHV